MKNLPAPFVSYRRMKGNLRLGEQWLFCGLPQMTINMNQAIQMPCQNGGRYRLQADLLREGQQLDNLFPPLTITAVKS